MWLTELVCAIAITIPNSTFANDTNFMFEIIPIIWAPAKLKISARQLHTKYKKISNKLISRCLVLVQFIHC